MTYPNRLNLKAWAEEDRPREKIIQMGKKQVSDAELIALLIGSGNRRETAVDLSKRILKSVNFNLHNLAELSLKDFQKFEGIGEAKSISIVAALELGARRTASNSPKKVKITGSASAFQILYPRLADLKHEEFCLLLLDRAHQVLGIRNISKGGVSGTIADAKLIFRLALEKLASSIILCHNHPSGNLKPSESDLQLTKKLKRAGENLDIAVLDHLIIGNNAYYSFADEGLI